MMVSRLGHIASSGYAKCGQLLRTRTLTAFHSPRIHSRINSHNASATTLANRKFSNLSQPPIPDPSMRLTGALLAKSNPQDLVKEIDEHKDYVNSWKSQNNIRFFLWDSSLNNKMIVHCRNILGKALMVDDELRMRRTSLKNTLKEEETHSLMNMISVARHKLDQLVGTRTDAKLMGELARICAALEVRLGVLDDNPINYEEKQKLTAFFTELWLKRSKHLVRSSILNFNASNMEKAKIAAVTERHQYLDDVCPLHLGKNEEELHQFILELPKQAQNCLLPLFEKRKRIVENDTIWQKLIESRILQKEHYDGDVEHSSIFAEMDVDRISECPTFARLLIKYGQNFSDDFYQNHYLFAFISMNGYFTSPHVSILFEEQHLHKQMKAAGDKLKEAFEEPNLLLIKSNFSEEEEWIPASQVPFSDIYIPDQFQSLVRAANLRNFDSSSQMKKQRVFYLPEKGLCKYDPTNLPESINDLTPFETHSSNSSPGTFTPAVSYKTENATIQGTHAFIKLTNHNKSHYLGKFGFFNVDYDNIKNIRSIFANIVPNLLGSHSKRILNPDQNVGYEDRWIAYLEKPISITDQQIKDVYELIRYHDTENCGKEFKILTKNCTLLPEEILKKIGIDLPCKAPMHSLLKQTNPLLARMFKWMSQHPEISNPILYRIGWFLGGRGADRLTTQKLDRILTPYILRIYISLKNCVDSFEK